MRGFLCLFALLAAFAAIASAQYCTSSASAISLESIVPGNNSLETGGVQSYQYFNQSAPACDADSSQFGQWFSWTAPSNVDGLFLSTCNNSNFDSVIHVYSSETGCNNCTCLSCLASNDDWSLVGYECSGSTQSIVKFNVTQGVTYYIWITGYDDESIGTYNMTFTANSNLISTPPAPVEPPMNPPVAAPVATPATVPVAAPVTAPVASPVAAQPVASSPKSMTTSPVNRNAPSAASQSAVAVSIVVLAGAIVPFLLL